MSIGGLRYKTKSHRRGAEIAERKYLCLVADPPKILADRNADKAKQRNPAGYKKWILEIINPAVTVVKIMAKGCGLLSV